MLSKIRRHLGWKIFFSYLIVILVGTIVLATAAEYAIPRAFDRHMTSMPMMMDDSMMGDMDFFTSFRSAVNEALTIAALAAFIGAVLVSLFVSRQVVAPIRNMMVVSQHIALGHYAERVAVPGNLGRDELDELAQLALSFNRMAANLEHTENMRRQLIGDVAHELRTPLTAIKGSMEGLIDGVLSPKNETFQQIHREADRMQRLVHDLQELSKVEAGAYELQKSPADVADLISTAIEPLRQQFTEKEVALEIDIADDLPRANVDRDRFGQVMINLMGNALQYTPARGKVNVRAELLGNEIHITVSDTGIGIPAEHLPHLFTRFYRVDKSRSRAGGGSGIGLTITKHLVEAHDGRIWVQSPGRGKGSAFTFTLPI